MSPMQPFATLPEAARRRLLELGPKWASDILACRNVVVEIYTPLLAQASRAGLEIQRDISYGPHERHRLDIYRPAAGQTHGPTGARGAPVVIFVHGGAFLRGDKDSNAEIYSNVPRWFARNGMLGINIEYRLAPEAPYPSGAEDVARSVAWVKAHAHEYGGDPQRIFLVGHSAGAAHVAAYVSDPVARPAQGPGVAGIVLISGRLRADVLPDNPNARGVRAYYGDDPSLYEARSCVTHAANIDVPLFIAIAQYENPYLDVYGAEMLHRVSVARGRAPRFVRMPCHNHTSIVAHFDTGEDFLGREIIDFIETGG